MIGLRFFPLKSADVRGTGTRDQPLRTSALEASTVDYSLMFSKCKLRVPEESISSTILPICHSAFISIERYSIG